MELVDGPTLEERMAAGPLPLEAALAIARQIAEALHCAHEKRIVHRDLKPANIKVRADGTVKVLDFRLAKALESGAGNGADEPHAPATVTAPDATQAGAMLGTAAYMSPEQARGEAADQRTDLWAFGVVLYEMLTGTRRFARPTVAETRAAVLTADPDWISLPPATPVAIRRLLRRCLAADRRARLVCDVRCS
jgi:serine/threonine protein kinase